MEGRGRGRGRARGRARGWGPNDEPVPPGRGGRNVQPLLPGGQGRGIPLQPREPPAVREQFPQGAQALDPQQLHPHPTSGGQPDLAKQIAQLDITSGAVYCADVPVGRGGARSRRDQFVEIVHTRPEHITTKQGTSGRRVNLITNYFDVKGIDFPLMQYRVDFSPEEDRTSVRKGMLKTCKEQLGGDYIFDGTQLFMNRRLRNDNTEMWCERQFDQAKIRVTVTFVKELLPSDYSYLTVFNLILRLVMGHLDLQLIRRNYYDMHAAIHIPEFNVDLLPGYITSIRQHENRLLLCVEIHHKVIRQSTVLELICLCFKKDEMNYQRLASEALLGEVIMTRYNNKTYRIDDIDWNKSPEDTFTMAGREISYIDYYKEKYGLHIEDKNQPLLVSRPRKKDIHRGQVELLYLVPELCFMTGYDQSMLRDFRMMKEVGQHTHQAPDKKVQVLQRFMNRVHSEPKCRDVLQNFKLDFSEEMVKVTGRVLNHEGIILNTETIYGGDGADWTRGLRVNHMLKVVKLYNWVVILPRNVMGIKDFLQNLTDVAKKMDFVIYDPQIMYTDAIRPQEYMKKIDTAYSQMNPQMIMIILLGNRKDLYGAVKRRCFETHGLPSQVVLSRNVTKKSSSISTKIAIQMNCKLGGAPWTVKMTQDLMIVGFDVYHNKARNGPSVGALVASLNMDQTRYISCVAIHQHQEEISSFIALNLVRALHRRKKVLGKYPSHIILYRDGVGLGQVGMVRDHEVTQIEQALKGIYGPSGVKFAFIIVNKRLNTRIMWQVENQGPIVNPCPGTIVDDEITLPERYDFYLISQTVRQGTVSPTSYSVIYDTLGIKPDFMQRLTYRFCHLYYNWTGTVSVPAPCQYAHKLAYMAGEYNLTDVKPDLDDTLYYL